MLIFSTQAWGRPYVAPPGIPVARLAMLRDAFDKTAVDPALIADAKRMRMTLREPLSGVKMQTMIAGYHKTPQSIIDRVKMFQKRPSGEKRIKRKRKKKK